MGAGETSPRDGERSIVEATGEYGEFHGSCACIAGCTADDGADLGGGMDTDELRNDVFNFSLLVGEVGPVAMAIASAATT